jgi:hypothetical protein
VGGALPHRQNWLIRAINWQISAIFRSKILALQRILSESFARNVFINNFLKENSLLVYFLKKT